MKIPNVAVLLEVRNGARLPAANAQPLLADVDECVTGTHNCQPGFSCQNTKGSFYCQARQRCMDGFLQDPEGNCVGRIPALPCLYLPTLASHFHSSLATSQGFLSSPKFPHFLLALGMEVVGVKAGESKVGGSSQGKAGIRPTFLLFAASMAVSA